MLKYTICFDFFSGKGDVHVRVVDVYVIRNGIRCGHGSIISVTWLRTGGGLSN